MPAADRPTGGHIEVVVMNRHDADKRNQITPIEHADSRESSGLKLPLKPRYYARLLRKLRDSGCKKRAITLNNRVKTLKIAPAVIRITRVGQTSKKHTGVNHG